MRAVKVLTRECICAGSPQPSLLNNAISIRISSVSGGEHAEPTTDLRR